MTSIVPFCSLCFGVLVRSASTQGGQQNGTGLSLTFPVLICGWLFACGMRLRSDCCGASGKAKQYNYCSDCSCLDPDAVVEACTTPCWKNAYQGDGFCDDDNNHCGCDWDDGDCCGGKTNYCSDCLCLDPDVDSTCSGGCGAPDYTGDLFCDDNNNNCGCDWDGGDCCGDSGKGKQYSYCDDCACLDPDDTSTGECGASCGASNFVGDGFCDDGNNNCGCDWDKGDCCGKSGKAKQFDYCDDCACLDPSAGCSGACTSPNFVGDGFCDDGNNVCGCDWDKGDCCGDSGKGKQYNYCTACDCRFVRRVWQRICPWLWCNAVRAFAESSSDTDHGMMPYIGWFAGHYL